MPYRTFDDRIDGLVITFINTSDIKQLEVELHETGQMHQLLLNSSSDAIIKLSTNLKIVEFNPEAEKLFGKKLKDALNQNFIQMFIPEPMQKKTEKEMNKLLKEAIDVKFKMQIIAADGLMPKVEWSVNILLNNMKMPVGIIMIKKS